MGYRFVFVLALGIFMAILYYAVRHLGGTGGPATTTTMRMILRV